MLTLEDNVVLRVNGSLSTDYFNRHLLEQIQNLESCILNLSLTPTHKAGKTPYPTRISNDQLQPLELCVTSSAHKESSHTSIQTPWDLKQENRSSASSRVITQTSRIMSQVPVAVVEANWQNDSAIRRY